MKIDKYWLFKIHSMADDGDAGGGGSLLPGATPPADGDQPPAGDPPADNPAGDDDQSWFLKDKYKTVEDQAKAYPELQKKLGESNKLLGAPEGDYELTMPEGIDGEFIADSPSVNNVLAYAKENNLSQDVVTGLIHAFVAGEAELNQTSVDREMKALGDNADRRLKDLSDYGAANLDQETYDAFRAVASTAAGVKVLEAMKGLNREHKLPGNGDDNINLSKSGHTPESLKEMSAAKDDNGHRKMSTDPAYKKKVDQAYADYYGSEPKATVIGG